MSATHAEFMAKFNPHITIDADNPSPFKQPFLVVTLSGDASKTVSSNDASVAHIDVDGQIEKYIDKNDEPTELLVELCKAFAKSGAVVDSFGRYQGSAGPSMLLRNGFLFLRHEAVEVPAADVRPYEYQKPFFNGN